MQRMKVWVEGRGDVSRLRKVVCGKGLYGRVVLYGLRKVSAR